jgi:hypothetical protein
MQSTYECPWMFKGAPFESGMLYKIKKDRKGKVVKDQDGSDMMELNKEIFSFIYIITDMENNKKYIGQKMFTTQKPVTKNKKTTKKTVESDWKNYFSSSETIKQLVKEQGSSKLKREIIYICCSKGQANYLETKLQFELQCLENQDDWYNGIVNLRCRWNHLKLESLIDKDDELLQTLYSKYRPSF